MRISPSEQSIVVKELPQGTPVQLLKTDLRNGYSYIQTQKKELGWVKTAYLVDKAAIKSESTTHKLWQRLMFWKTTPTVKSTPVISSSTPLFSNDKHISLRQKQVVITAQLNQLQSQIRSEEHTSELQSHSFISYAVFCLKKKK